MTSGCDIYCLSGLYACSSLPTQMKMLCSQVLNKGHEVTLYYGRHRPISSLLYALYSRSRIVLQSIGREWQLYSLSTTAFSSSKLSWQWDGKLGHAFIWLEDSKQSDFTLFSAVWDISSSDYLLYCLVPNIEPRSQGFTSNQQCFTVTL